MIKKMFEVLSQANKFNKEMWASLECEADANLNYNVGYFRLQCIVK